MVRSTYSPEGRAIALALALGAALGVKETMLQSMRSIEDSDNSFREHIVSKYTGLRTLIQERYATVRLAQFEEPLGAQARKDVAEDLTKTGADRDKEVWRWASSLLTGVQGWAFVAFRAAETFHGGLEKKDFERAYTHLFGSWLAYLEMSPQDIDNAIDSIRLFGDVWGGVSSSSIRFTVYYPKEIEPEKWFTLIVYVHIPEMQSMIEADVKLRLELPKKHGLRTAMATSDIARGADITIVPELPGCRFNPASASLAWLEDWHRIEFRLQAQPDSAGFELGKAVNGRVTFYVESVLVGEVPIWTCISDEADTTAADAPGCTASAKPYEAIFVSYAHEDSVIVNKLGRAYKALGMEFLRDVEKLRSGEEWNSALLSMIERSNIFQLYWSRAAKHSRYVEAEWRYALGQGRTHFIRPLYWQLPMPKPPSELARLHFSYLDLD